MSQDIITIGSYNGRAIGSGGFATVYKARGASGKTLALKLCDEGAGEEVAAALYHEFAVQSVLSHPQIPFAHEYGRHLGRPFIVLDWVEGLPFWEMVKESGGASFLLILRQFAEILSFVHHHGWVHGDIKPENVLWQSGPSIQSNSSLPTLSLLDFGLARRSGDEDRPRGAGTLGYCAPEFLERKSADGRADWYAVGCILYEWIFGLRPYESDEPAHEVAGHLEATPDFGRPRQRSAPPWADDVVCRLLSKNPDDRGKDSCDIIRWLAELDDSFDFDAIRSAQLQAYRQTQDRVLTSDQLILIASVHETLVAGMPAHLNVSSHGPCCDTLPRHLVAACAELGYDVVQEEESTNGSWVIHDRADQAVSLSRVHITFQSRPQINWPVRVSEVATSLTFLPWNRDAVGEYLAGLSADTELADVLADTVYEATGGIAAAVSSLAEHLIAYNVFAGGDEATRCCGRAVESWKSERATAFYVIVLGSLDGDEKEVVEWLALGSGHGASVLLPSLCSHGSTKISEVCGALIARGVIVADASEPPPLDIRLRLIGHDSAVRSLIPTVDLENRSRALAESLSNSKGQTDGLYYEVLARAFERGLVWPEAAANYLDAAQSAVAQDIRNRALDLIGSLEYCASHVEDSQIRAHYVGRALMLRGDIQKASGELEAARRTYRQLLVLCRSHHDQRLLAETLHDLGDLYRITRRFSKGIRAERQALRIWEGLHDHDRLSRSMNSLGNLSYIACEYPEARDYYFQALSIQRELGLNALAATNLNNLGLVYMAQFDLANAERYYTQALEIHQSLVVPVEEARDLNNIGAVKYLQGANDAAIEFFSRAATLNAEAGAQAEELYNHRNLIEVAMAQGDYRTALTVGQQIHRVACELGDASTQSEVSALLADAACRAGDFRLAARFHAETQDLATQLKNDDLGIYLALQSASRNIRFSNPAAALAILDAAAPLDHLPTDRHRLLESLILRLRISSALGDGPEVKRLWERGCIEAEAVAARHKIAELAWTLLSGSAGDKRNESAESIVHEFLTESTRWHWASAFSLWCVGRLIENKALDEAEALINQTISGLRRDGNWDNLWQALVLAGRLHSARADYEPAIRALDEADRTLKIVVATVDDDSERRAYHQQSAAQELESIRARIALLVG